MGIGHYYMLEYWGLGVSVMCRMVSIVLRKWNANTLTATKMKGRDQSCIDQNGGSRWTKSAELKALENSGLMIKIPILLNCSFNKRGTIAEFVQTQFGQ